MPSIYAHAGPEPALAELLLDPVIRAVMQRDGVDDGTLCRVIAIGRFHPPPRPVSSAVCLANGRRPIVGSPITPDRC